MATRTSRAHRWSPLSSQLDRLSRQQSGSVSSVVIAVVMGVAGLAVELVLGAYGHGTHLLLFLLMTMIGALAFGPRSGFVVLAAGAVGSAIASLAGFGPSDSMAKLALQLGLYIGLGTTGLLVLTSAIDALRDAPMAPPLTTQGLGPNALTPREREVLRLAAGGMSVHDIAECATQAAHADSRRDGPDGRSACLSHDRIQRDQAHR